MVLSAFLPKDRLASGFLLIVSNHTVLYVLRIPIDQVSYLPFMDTLNYTTSKSIYRNDTGNIG